jgi:ABC-type multidrug transport system, ATPase and permease components
MKEMLKLLPYIKQYKGMFTGGILLMICMVGFELAGPLIAAAIIDNHIKLGEGNILIRPILYLVALFLTIKMMHAVASYYAQIVLISAGTRAVQKMRLDVFKHVQQLPIRYFDNLPAGKVVARITNDTESILQLFASVIPMFMVSILTIFSITAIVFYVHFWTGVVMLLFIPVIIIWSVLL